MVETACKNPTYLRLTNYMAEFGPSRFWRLNGWYKNMQTPKCQDYCKSGHVLPRPVCLDTHPSLQKVQQQGNSDTAREIEKNEVISS